MRQRLALLVLPTALLAGTDLIVKSVLPTQAWLLHPRSGAWAALSVAVLGAALLFVCLPSRLVAAASGVLAGGVLGNLVSAGLDDGRVPNPFVWTGDRGTLAFNLADVFVLAGIVLQTAALVEVTIRYRHVLPESTVVVRLVRRLRR